MVDTRKTVLLIENDMDFAQVVIHWLSLLGYVVLFADSRERALEIMESHGEPDCVILDWFMPGMTLPKYMDYMRKNFPTVPVLAVSASPNLAEKSAQLNIYCHLAKPFTVEQLSTAIPSCIIKWKKRSDGI